MTPRRAPFPSANDNRPRRRGTSEPNVVIGVLLLLLIVAALALAGGQDVQTSTPAMPAHTTTKGTP